MIEHVWTVVCSRAVIDRKSNNASLQNVLEQVTIGRKPEPGTAVAVPMDVATLWARTSLDVPVTGKGRFRLDSPSGTIAGPFDFEIALVGSHTRSRTIAHLDAFPIQGPGQYRFYVELWNEQEAQWCQVASVPLEVRFESTMVEDVAGESV